MGDFAQLMDLFQEGAVLELAKGGQTVTVWVKKLSPFELEEARMAGRVARARTMLALREVGSPEYDLIKLDTAALDEAGLVALVLGAERQKNFADVVRELHSDPDWQERIEVFERTGSQLAGRADDDPEVLLVAKAGREYTEHVTEMVEQLRLDRSAQLEGSTREQLERAYLDTRLETAGLESFTREFRCTEVYHAMRWCKGTKADGKWEHSKCAGHEDRVCERTDVQRLPQTVWDQVRTAIDELNMPVDVARFSDAPASSSASLEQPSEAAAESTPSTPVETPTELVGTSA